MLHMEHIEVKMVPGHAPPSAELKPLGSNEIGCPSSNWKSVEMKAERGSWGRKKNGVNQDALSSWSNSSKPVRSNKWSGEWKGKRRTCLQFFSASLYLECALDYKTNKEWSILPFPCVHEGYQIVKSNCAFDFVVEVAWGDCGGRLEMVGAREGEGGGCPRFQHSMARHWYGLGK